MARLFRGPAIYLVLVLLLLWAFLSFVSSTRNVKDLSLDQFEKYVHDGQVETATIFDRDQRVEGQLRDTAKTKYRVNYTNNYDDDITNLLSERDDIRVKVDIQKTSPVLSIIFQLLPF